VRVSHYFEWERWITGGHAQSVRNQREILDRQGVAYTTRPDPAADLLHLNNMGPRSVLAARRARKRGTPVLVHAHQTAEDFRESFALSNWLARPLRPYLEHVYGYADHLVCPSEFNADEMARYAPGVPKTVVSNGFDPEKVAGHDDPDLRQEYLDRYDLDPPVVFMVGHVIERKGLRSFVETAREMPDTDFAWFGYLNPGGGTVDRLLRSRETTKLVNSAPDNCTFTGYVEDIAGAYAAGDVLFWPSKNENEGMALLEAMACGKPVVIRDIPTYEWLDDGTDCIKAESSFVQPLARVTADEDLRKRLGAAAAERSEAFTLDRVGEDLMAVYAELTGEDI
jgi:1,2-diacylglycerol-3-alpha-glucose alpha-1,2-glucosyltransferase